MSDKDEQEHEIDPEDPESIIDIVDEAIMLEDKIKKLTMELERTKELKRKHDEKKRGVLIEMERSDAIRLIEGIHAKIDDVVKIMSILSGRFSRKVIEKPTRISTDRLAKMQIFPVSSGSIELSAAATSQLNDFLVADLCQECPGFFDTLEKFMCIVFREADAAMTTKLAATVVKLSKSNPQSDKFAEELEEKARQKVGSMKRKVGRPRKNTLPESIAAADPPILTSTVTGNPVYPEPFSDAEFSELNVRKDEECRARKKKSQEDMATSF